MDNSFLQNKENILYPLPKTDLSRTLSENTNNSASLRAKGKSKTQKNVNNTVRAGDWVCLLCNNLNFSFRSECNRCGLQTKKQNYIQNLMIISEKPGTTTVPERQPLKDLTNIQHIPKETQMKNEEINIEKLFPTDFSFDLGLNMRSQSQPAETVEKEPLRFQNNYGFESVVLLTPPRVNLRIFGAQESTNEKQSSNGKFLPPYQSPQELPSISPILRRVFGKEATESNEPSAKLENLPSYKRNLSFAEPSEMQVQRLQRAVSWNCDEEKPSEISYLREIENFIQGEQPNNMNAPGLYSNPIPQQMFNMKPFASQNEPIQFGCVRPVTLPFLEEFTANTQQFVQQQPLQQYMQEPQVKKERKADWVCAKCNNLNYSFRKACNRCQMNK